LHVRKFSELRLEVSLARDDLVGRRLVVRRSAADGRCDECIAQAQPVLDRLRSWHIGEAVAVQRRHQKITRTSAAIAGEHAAGAIRTVRSRCEAQDQQARGGITKPRDRLRPVSVVSECSALDAANLGAVLA
jgi:hypothetical protein